MELSSTARLQTMLTGGNLRWAGAFSLVGARTNLFRSLSVPIEKLKLPDVRL